MKTIIAFFAFILIASNVMAGNNKPVPAFAESTLLVSKSVTVHTDVKGNVIATSRFISDLQLPLPVLRKLMKKCPDYTFRYIREFDADGRMTYVIALENETGFKLVKISNGSFKTLETMTKSF